MEKERKGGKKRREKESEKQNKNKRKTCGGFILSLNGHCMGFDRSSVCSVTSDFVRVNCLPHFAPYIGKSRGGRAIPGGGGGVTYGGRYWREGDVD